MEGPAGRVCQKTGRLCDRSQEPCLQAWRGKLRVTNTNPNHNFQHMIG
jgi:hypothetical protein